MPDSSPTIHRRRFLQRAAAASVVGFGGTGLYAWRIEPHWVEVVTRPMPLARLPQALVGRRLVQLSDLHVGPIVDNAYLRGVCRRVADLEPEYLALTGDFMTSQQGEQIDATLATLRELPIATTPTVAVLGNHDYGHAFRDRITAARLADGLRKIGVQLLRNESLEIDGLQFAGCDDLWAHQHSAEQTLDQFDTSRAGVLMAHNPDLVDLVGWEQFQGWVLSGHTHGGQCRLPGWGAPILPVRNHAYCAGHVQLGPQRDLYINRGIGYKRRVRFGVRPEVTIFELTTA